jgi:hypothetical protein
LGELSELETQFSREIGEESTTNRSALNNSTTIREAKDTTHIYERSTMKSARTRYGKVN